MEWMMNNNLEKETNLLKSKFARTYHNDGLLDFFVGWGLISTGLFLLTSSTFFSFAGWMPILLVAPLKTRIVIPRWGYARFSEPTSIPKPILIGAGAFIVFGVLLIYFLFDDLRGIISPIAMAVIGLSFVVVLATGLNRVAFYAVGIPLFFIVGLGLKVLTPTFIILVGAVLMIIGLSLFVIFLKKYPLIKED
jgi:hypothetical protein